MRVKEYIAHRLIGTPLEGPARGLRELTKLPSRIRHPELQEIHVESERAELAMRRLIGDSMNCIDIGAHLGSVLSRINHLSPHGQHIAIEPIPYKYRWLKQKFPNVEVVQTALSNSDGEATFYVQPQRSGFSGLRLRGSSEEADQEIEILTVRLARLDDIVPHHLPIGFIKIDVEGAELLALQGGERILRANQPGILFECFPGSLQPYNIVPREIYDFFSRHSYSVFLIKDWLSHGQSLTYERFIQSMQYPFQAFNFLAMPRKGE